MTVDGAATWRKLCAKFHIQPQPAVEAALRSLPEVDLSQQTLSVEACTVLGKWLQTCHVATKVSLAECLLEPAGVKSLLLGLRDNTSVHTLSLKGNNIHGDTTANLAAFLARNSTLRRLSLEWNPTGECQASFQALCEAIAGNGRLQYLDLRSNQLCPDHATSVAALLTSNNALVSLDLRWNKLGNQGGRAVLNALKLNFTLTRCDLTGNCIDHNILTLIDHEVQRCNRTAVQISHTVNEVGDLRQRLEMQSLASAGQVDRLRHKLEHTEHLLEDTRRQLDIKTNAAQEDHNKASALQATVHELQRNAQESAEQRATANQQLTDARAAAAAQQDQDAQKLQELRRALAETEKERDEITHRLTLQVDEWEQKSHQLKAQLLSQQEQQVVLHGQLKATKTQAEKTLEEERTRHQRAERQQHLQQEQDCLKLKQRHQDQMSSASHQVAVHTEARLAAEAELLTTQAKLKATTVAMDANLAALKQKMKIDQASQARELEVRAAAAERDRADVEEALSRQTAENTHLTQQLLALTCRYNHLNTNNIQLQGQVENARAEVGAKEAQVREEYRDADSAATKATETIMALQETVDTLNSQISSQQMQHNSEIKKVKDEELRRQEEEDRRREEGGRRREEEAKRAGKLHAALLSYLSSCGAPGTAGPTFGP